MLEEKTKVAELDTSRSINSNLNLGEKLRRVDKKLTQMCDRLASKEILWDSLKHKTLIRKNIFSLINEDIRSESYNHINRFTVDPESSGEEFDDEICSNGPSVWDVCQHIIDPQIFCDIDQDESKFPDKVRQGLIFKNFDTCTIKDFKCSLEQLDFDIYDLNEINIFKVNSINIAVVLFNSLKTCQKVHSLFTNEDAHNSEGKHISVAFAYDRTDLKNHKWYAVVLRNLLPHYEVQALQDFVLYYVKTESKLFYCLDPCWIGESLCAVIVLDDLETAENFCFSVNNSVLKTGKSFVKAHLHHKSCKWRRNPECSHFAKFFKNNKKNQMREKLKTENRSLKIKNVEIAKVSPSSPPGKQSSSAAISVKENVEEEESKKQIEEKLINTRKQPARIGESLLSKKRTGDGLEDESSFMKSKLANLLNDEISYRKPYTVKIGNVSQSNQRNAKSEKQEAFQEGLCTKRGKEEKYYKTFREQHSKKKEILEKFK